MVPFRFHLKKNNLSRCYFKIPREVVLADRLPKTASGKLDRMALARTYSPAEAAGDAATTNRERAVAEIFATVLELATVGRRDNFFILGGDSMRANMVLARIEAKFGTRLSVMSFFRAPTVERVAAKLDANT